MSIQHNPTGTTVGEDLLFLMTFEERDDYEEEKSLRCLVTGWIDQTSIPDLTADQFYLTQHRTVQDTDPGINLQDTSSFFLEAGGDWSNINNNPLTALENVDNMPAPIGCSEVGFDAYNLDVMDQFIYLHSNMKSITGNLKNRQKVHRSRDQLAA